MIFSWIREKCKVFDYCITKSCIFEFLEMKQLIWSFDVCEDLYYLWENGLIETNQFLPFPIYMKNDRLERM